MEVHRDADPMSDEELAEYACLASESSPQTGRTYETITANRPAILLILRPLAQTGGMARLRPAAIAARHGVTKQAINDFLARLEEAGLIERPWRGVQVLTHLGLRWIGDNAPAILRSLPRPLPMPLGDVHPLTDRILVLVEDNMDPATGAWQASYQKVMALLEQEELGTTSLESLIEAKDELVRAGRLQVVTGRGRYPTTWGLLGNGWPPWSEDFIQSLQPPSDPRLASALVPPQRRRQALADQRLLRVLRARVHPLELVCVATEDELLEAHAMMELGVPLRSELVATIRRLQAGGFISVEEIPGREAQRYKLLRRLYISHLARLMKAVARWPSCINRPIKRRPLGFG